MNTTIAQAFALATQHHAAGQFPQAEERYLAILAQDPQHLGSLHNLGLVALQRGDARRGLELLGRAVASRGANAMHWNDLGVARHLLGDLPGATAAFEYSVRLDPTYVSAHCNLGIAWQQRGELDRAEACHREAIRLKPTFAEAFNNLGNVLHARGDLEAAAAAFEQAVRIRPEFTDAVNSQGVVTHELGDLPLAMECYRRVLTLQPGHADASNNLATALKEQGRIEEALAQYRETLRLQPDHALAHYHLSQFAHEGWYRFGADEIERMKAFLATGKGNTHQRSLFCFALADTLDRLGAIDESFGYYRQGNELRRQHFRDTQQGFDARHHRAFVDGLIATFDAAYYRRVQGWGHDTEAPVFVIGMPRSGSTLVEQILASHPTAYGAGELGEMPRVLDRLAREGAAARPPRNPFLLPDAAAARAMADGYLSKLQRRAGGAARVIDKTLENVFSLGVLAALFPRARVIHCRRDPIDTGVSCYFQNFQHLNFAWTLEDIGVYHREYERLMAHWARALPLPMLEVAYEDLVHHPDAVSRKLLAFCGLSWDERCLTFYQTQRVVRTASSLQVRRPLSTKSIGRWKRYRAHLDPLLRALGLPADGEPGTLPQGDTTISFVGMKRG
jgi:tetratricopeptide (TPR) repeat protein